MKRFLLIILMLSFSMGVAFSIEPSVGAQLTYETSTDFQSYTHPFAGDFSQSRTTPAFGGSLFLDAEYALLSVGFLINPGYSAEQVSYGVTTSTDEEWTFSFLTIGLLGKYPINLDGIVLFPMAGVEYFHNLVAEDADGNDLKNGASDEELESMNRIYLRIGFGADFDLTEELYLRVTALGGYKFRTTFENNIVETMENMGATDVNFNTFDFQANVGVGFKL